MSLTLRPVSASDADWVRRILRKFWASTKIVSRGHIHAADELPGFLAVQDDKRVGLVTYRITRQECEIVTLNSLSQRRGIGTALIDAVKQEAASRGCRRLWLVTTNDNTAALRFFQRRGFVLAALHKNALDLSRRLKPEIPLTGIDGIPVRDEIELELPL